VKQVTKHIILIVVVGLLVYALSLHNSFVWDDEEQIINNTLVHSLANWKSFFTGGAFNSGGTGHLLGNYYKPLMTFTFSLLYSTFGPNPFAFHLTSLILYISSAILIFLFFKKFFTESISLILSLIFLVHPLYSEVVFYSANLQDVLFFFFGMLSLFNPIFLIFSLLSKETGIIFVFIGILYSFLFDKKRIKKVIVVSVLTIFIYAFLRFGIAKIGFEKVTLAPLAQENLVIRLVNLPKIAFYYIQNVIYPYNLVPNQHWYITKINFSDFFLPLLILIALLTLAFVPVFKKNKIYTFFLIIFLISFIFHLQIFPLDVTVSGRWFYLPMFGLLGCLGSLIPKNNQKLPIIAAIIIAILGFRTFVRSFDWADGMTLYSHDTQIIKDDFNLENNLGVELYRIGKIKDASVHFQNSVALAPFWWTNWNNLGAYEESIGNYEAAKNYYQKAIDNSDYYLAYENYAKILIKQGKKDEAKKFLEEIALKKFPQNQNLIFLLQIL
jgi:tetratricopeptide (TPR) repeat protein